jgi:hypothetical protein
MSDTTHVEVPASDGSPQLPPPPGNDAASPPIPEEILEEWRWIMKGRDEGVFDEYPGKHVAVYQQKIWGSSYDPELLREYLALKHQMDPERFVIVYIDRW